MKKLAILGAGGHGRVIADVAELLGWDSIVFFDDDPRVSVIDDWICSGSFQELIKSISSFDGVAVGVGSNSTRASLFAKLADVSAPLVSLVHPKASVSSRAKIGRGTVVLAGAVVNTGATLGEGCIVNTSSSIDHDCRVGSFVHISPGAALAGDVVLGSQVWIGLGASVVQGISVDSGTCVGAGAVVISNLPAHVTAVGVPARILQG
ncbi:acetyltransferase [Marinobacterium sp. xm-d-530]|uniref:acetyltransferase n=1 Tax=Marinobacterium sp. xm-d-530 TaxID=2497747 RepID=UPI00156A2E52|nr:acetyltransferase [Marinobacterium sp. xm-d-530]NRQ01163.1 putative acetyltransferase EpsM [Marinobacterium sp. xm-d-530]